tara:strand:- start:28 stop:846 length:819 start_codon:yes stop_codon:yes gene_type:complete
MENYISTKDEKFDVKKEYKRLTELMRQPSLYKGITPNMMLAYEKEYVVTRVDDRTGEVYRFDTNLGVRYKPKLSLSELNKNKLEMHPALKFYYESNNIPIPPPKTEVNTNDLKYLEARINYERALSYQTEGNIRTRGLGLNTYNDKVNSDRKNNRFLEDGVTTIYEASYKGKLNALEAEMNNFYAESSYFNNDLAALDTKVETIVETETKENENNKKVEVPVQRDDRYLEMQKRQRELDQTINKNPMRDNLTITNKKDVKTYDLRNLLQIEQ